MLRVQLSACLIILSLPHSTAGVTIPGDYDNDGLVGPADLAALIACFDGPPGHGAPDCAALSLDGDADVDLHDFAMFARVWLTGDCRVTATASSAEATPVYDAFSAIDGMRSTRWSSSFADNQWIQLDFGRTRTLAGVTLHWEAAYARGYSVLVSHDAVNWTIIFSTTIGDGGSDEISFPPVEARYLRVFCAQRGTEWGNSLWEIEVDSPDRCYQDPRSAEERIDELLAAMTLAERTSLLYGETAMSLRSVPRLGIPALQLADGPLGIRWEQATAFPAPIAMAATWDPKLMQRFGAAMGREYRNKGRQIWLAPGMNIIRVPQCGRNFEYYSEDPYLASRMAVAAIRGAQAEGIVACAKHYACNNQEYERTTVNIQVDERTLREIYLPAFEASVREAGVWSVMAAYNRVNGPYCTANTHLLTDILKNSWGFRGFVVSDWGAVHEVVAPALAGMDLEMDGASPTGAYWGNGALLSAVQSGSVSLAQVDDKVRRILRALLHTGLLDARWDSPNREMTEHNALAREIAREGIVLLKNEGNRLPSVQLTADTPYDLVLEYFEAAGDAAAIFVCQENTALAAAVAAAQAADAALVFVGLDASRESEGYDRGTIKLTGEEIELIRSVAEVNPNTVVVIIAGSQVEFDGWLDDVSVVLQAWYGGQEAGNAIADIVFGNENPGAKLPMTFVNRWEDHPAYGLYPSGNYTNGLNVGYRYFDQPSAPQPAFPFGFGLSYTTFAYRDLSVDTAGMPVDGSVRVDFTVENTGARAGAEIAQVYVCDVAATVPRPLKELKGFAKIVLAPGAQATVSVTLGHRAFTFYDTGSADWVVEPGAFEIQVGSSSRDIHLTETINVP